MKKVAMLQPNYIPWKGVFDLISRVDAFVFYDDVQYTVKDWRNRNKIKTKDGELWLTVPVITKGRREQLVCEAEIDNTTDWQKKHYKTIVASYLKAPYFKSYEYLLKEIYLERQWAMLADLDIFSTKLIAEALGLNVEWHKSSDLMETGDKHGEKVVKICKRLGCDYFLNGPASRGYMDDAVFAENHVILDYISYDYREYPQMYGPFTHQVSILDLLFHCGPDARQYIQPLSQ
jgi:hypothetical protein